MSVRFISNSVLNPTKTENGYQLETLFITSDGNIAVQTGSDYVEFSCKTHSLFVSGTYKFISIGEYIEITPKSLYNRIYMNSVLTVRSTLKIDSFYNSYIPLLSNASIEFLSATTITGCIQSSNGSVIKVNSKHPIAGYAVADNNGILNLYGKLATDAQVYCYYSNSLTIYESGTVNGTLCLGSESKQYVAKSRCDIYGTIGADSHIFVGTRSQGHLVLEPGTYVNIPIAAIGYSDNDSLTDCSGILIVHFDSRIETYRSIIGYNGKGELHVFGTMGKHTESYIGYECEAYAKVTGNARIGAFYVGYKSSKYSELEIGDCSGDEIDLNPEQYQGFVLLGSARMLFIDGCKCEFDSLNLTCNLRFTSDVIVRSSTLFVNSIYRECSMYTVNLNGNLQLFNGSRLDILVDMRYGNLSFDLNKIHLDNSIIVVKGVMKFGKNTGIYLTNSTLKLKDLIVTDESNTYVINSTVNCDSTVLSLLGMNLIVSKDKITNVSCECPTIFDSINLGDGQTIISKGDSYMFDSSYSYTYDSIDTRPVVLFDYSKVYHTIAQN